MDKNTRKLQQINRLSNVLTSGACKRAGAVQIGYLIHRIIDAPELTPELYDDIACILIASK